MNRWPSLLRRFAAADAQAKLEQARLLRTQRARSDLHAWYQDRERHLLSLLHRTFSERAHELHESGMTLSVLRELRDGGLGCSRYHRSPIHLRFGGAEMVVYSSLSDGTPLWIHWGWLIRSSRGRYPRVLSANGARVQRSQMGEPILLVRSQAPNEALWTVEDVAVTVLRMLADAALSRTRRVRGTSALAQ